MTDTQTVSIPISAGAADMPELHANLLQAFEAGASLRIEVEGEADRALTPLALQLIVSAERSFPSDRLQLDEAAQTALAALSSRQSEDQER